jgi:hypothetical protein
LHNKERRQHVLSLLEGNGNLLQHSS